MPSHEPLGNSLARLLKKSRISAQAAVLVVTGIAISRLLPTKPSSRCSFVFFALLLLQFLICATFPVSVSVILVFGSAPTLHVRSITLGRRENVQEAEGGT